MGLLLAGRAWVKMGMGNDTSSSVVSAATGGVFYVGGGSEGTTGHFGFCPDLFMPLMHAIGLLQAN